MRSISIKAARVDVGLTQEEMAVALGVTKKTVSSWEKGETKPTLDKIEAICTLVKRSYDEIRWKV